MRWVEEAEVLGDSAEDMEDVAETCIFCHKVLSSHHAFTAHLRAHSEDLNNHVFNVIAAATRPMGISDIQTLSGISVDVRNSVTRLMKQNKVRRIKRGRYVANKGIAAQREPVTKKETVAVTSSMNDNEWDALILLQLKKHPELYKRINDEVMAGIKKYIAFSAIN